VSNEEGDCLNQIKMECNEELVCLTKVNGERWERNILSLRPGNLSFLNADSFCLEWSIQPDCFLSIKIGSDQTVLITACPTRDTVRKLTEFEIELDSLEHVQKLKEFLENGNFVPATRKKLLVIINPASGKGKAPKIWKKIAKMIESTDNEFEVVLTEKAGHAKEIAKNLAVDEYGGVVTVSGDGGLWEITNGLYARSDWPEVCSRVPLGLVPGGSGHAMHCSLLFHQKEPFDQEYVVSALNVAHGNSMAYDYIECSTKSSKFISLFGIAWGVIPFCDVGSEFMRFLGPSRGKILALWRWIFPIFWDGKVHYQPFDVPDDGLMPGIEDPVPHSWKTVEGPFLNVYACKQPWLDYEMFFCPDAKPDDGIIWLVIIKDTITRKEGMLWMLNAGSAGHLHSQSTIIVPVRKFRFVPSQPESAAMTVDAEHLAGGVVQGVVRTPQVQIMVK